MGRKQVHGDICKLSSCTQYVRWDLLGRRENTEGARETEGILMALASYANSFHVSVLPPQLDIPFFLKGQSYSGVLSGQTCKHSG